MESCVIGTHTTSSLYLYTNGLLVFTFPENKDRMVAYYRSNEIIDVDAMINQCGVYFNSSEETQRFYSTFITVLIQ